MLRYSQRLSSRSARKSASELFCARTRTLRCSPITIFIADQIELGGRRYANAAEGRTVALRRWRPARALRECHCGWSPADSVLSVNE